MELRIKRLDKGLDMPTYSHADDAAFDLRAREKTVLKPKEKKVVMAGISLAIPQGHVGLVWDRSGMAAKHSLHVMAGVIDSGYRGEVGVVLINLGDEDFMVERNMRIAQMLIQPVAQPTIVETSDLDKTARDSSGFGSTGVH